MYISDNVIDSNNDQSLRLVEFHPEIVYSPASRAKDIESRSLALLVCGEIKRSLI